MPDNLLLQRLTLRISGSGWQVESEWHVKGTPMTRTKVEEFKTLDEAFDAMVEHAGAGPNFVRPTP